MGHLISNSKAMLIQGATMSDLEKMMSRLLDKKLTKIVASTTKVEKQSKNELYRRQEAADKLRISLVTLDNWTKSGIINSRKIGTRIYYTGSDINNALEKASKE